MKANDCLRELGYVIHCFKCRNRKTVYKHFHIDESFCDLCGSKMWVVGPMWLGDLADSNFCNDMIKVAEGSYISSNRRLINIIDAVKNEISYPPFFWNIDDLCSRHGIRSLPIDLIIQRLNDLGFKAVRSHTNERGLKTNASIRNVEEVISNI